MPALGYWIIGIFGIWIGIGIAMLIKRYAIVITYNDGMVYLHGIYIYVH